MVGSGRVGGASGRRNKGGSCMLSVDWQDVAAKRWRLDGVTMEAYRVGDGKEKRWSGGLGGATMWVRRGICGDKDGGVDALSVL